jgi:hypothetical protein
MINLARICYKNCFIVSLPFFSTDVGKDSTLLQEHEYQGDVTLMCSRNEVQSAIKDEVGWPNGAFLTHDHIIHR